MADLRSDFPDFDTFKSAFDAQDLALFLDVDGTLLEIARRPDSVRVTAPLQALMTTLLARNQGAVALVSGRQLADLDRLFAPLLLPAAGLHGLERRNALGSIQGNDHHADLNKVRAFLSEHSYAGVLVEDKGSAIVLHYREHPQLEQHCRQTALQAVRHAEGRWQVVPGKMSVEIRVAGVSKRDAIAAFLSEEPFLGRKAAFFGDDVTDEEGFSYVNLLDGWSVHIGGGAGTVARATLSDPAAVWHLLDRLLQPPLPAAENSA